MWQHAHAQFTDTTSASGLSYAQADLGDTCNFGEGLCEAERMSGGGAVGDADNDGDHDVFVTRLDAPDILFLNNGDGTFEDATAGSGLDEFDIQSNGALWIDIDNDDDQDLYITTLSNGPPDTINNRNYLFINDGTGVFSEQALERGAALASSDIRTTYSIAPGDYDRDGWIDLHVTVWMAQAASSSILLTNRGAAAPGHFVDTTERAGLAMSDVHAFASSFSDLDDDGWPDLAVTADFGTSRLYWNNGDGTFTDGTREAGVGTDENGMGSSIADVDGDGDLDWFISAIFDPAQTCYGAANCGWGNTGNRLYLNEGNRRFRDATNAAGVRDGAWGWGSAFFDADNDGDLDLGLTNGVHFPGSVASAPFNDDPLRLWINDAGAFSERAAEYGMHDTGSGKGYLVFDYDNDGDQDVFIVNNVSGAVLYRNDTPREHGWLRVNALGRASNRDAIGTSVYVKTSADASEQRRVVQSTSHFLGQSEHAAHFGLGVGDEPIASVRVEWPSGLVSEYADVPRNTVLDAEEPLPAVNLHAAVLPGARVIKVGVAATVMATLINAGADDAKHCTVRLPHDLPVTLTVYSREGGAWQTVTAQQGIDIPSGAAQTLLLSLTASAPFDTTQARLVFTCRNAFAASVISHVNTLTLTSTLEPSADVIAMSATASADGIATLTPTSGGQRQGAFAVATTNVGDSSTVVVSTTMSAASASIKGLVCRTDPTTGSCLAPPARALSLTMNKDTTHTFAVIVRGTAPSAFSPATHRALVRFTDASTGQVCGSTSVALR